MSFINTKTGNVINLMEDEDFSDVEDEGEEREFNLDHCLSLPEKDELDDFGIMEDFCSEIENTKLQSKLLNSLGGKGSFRRFKEVLHSNDIQDDWYRFRYEKFKEIAIEFCMKYKSTDALIISVMVRLTEKNVHLYP
ncbi:MAG: hypothetical protein H0T62_04710 [Parachlamydiaceae bacterium]|nr:hypothetical protein [Parachlamydiaceae bacterium]